MPGDPHPAGVALDTRNAATILADEKLGLERIVADVDEVRGTDFTGQFGGIYVRETLRRYKLDTGSTAEDDGDDNAECIIDGNGNHFVAQDGKGLTQIDFGSAGSGSASIEVSGKSGIAAGAVVRATIMAATSDDRPADEHWVDPPLVTAGNIVAGAGFTIYGVPRVPGQVASGAWTVAYEWKN